MHNYEIIVGNIGSVHQGRNKREALKKFRFYVADSKTGLGRSGNQPVTLMIDSDVDPKHDYQPSSDTE